MRRVHGEEWPGTNGEDTTAADARRNAKTTRRRRLNSESAPSGNQLSLSEIMAFFLDVCAGRRSAKGKKLSVDHAITYSGLDHLHRHGVLHRGEEMRRT